VSNGHLHHLRAVSTLARPNDSRTRAARTSTVRWTAHEGLGAPRRHDKGVSDWHTRWAHAVGTVRPGPRSYSRKPIFAVDSDRYGLCFDRSMLRTLSVAVASILLAGCGTSSANGTVDTAAGASSGGAGTGSGGQHTGSGGASAGSSAASAGSAGATTGSGGANMGSGGANMGSGGTSAGAGGASAGSGGGAPLSCDSLTCGATQYCVKPCCGGNAPACMAKPDGGTCPAGTHQGCSNGGQCLNQNDCCQFDPCTPAPPYCSDKVPVGCLLEGRMCQMVCA
jgi:hypothetical protein